MHGYTSIHVTVYLAHQLPQSQIFYNEYGTKYTYLTKVDNNIITHNNGNSHTNINFKATLKIQLYYLTPFGNIIQLLAS